LAATSSISRFTRERAREWGAKQMSEQSVFESWVALEKRSKVKTGNYADPTPEMLADPTWNAIWEEIKHWDINVPSEYGGYCGATGNHTTAIYQAIAKVRGVKPND
jgi:hypothetical protein